jgi:glycosyltransferase involved in cell wall biosynthesis
MVTGLAVLFLLVWLGLFFWIDYRLASPKTNVEQTISDSYPHDDVAVLIAFKDEASNLAQLLKSIIGAVSHERRVEIILINDHSTDNGDRIIKDMLHVMPDPWSLTCLKNEGDGKKAALLFGLKNTAAKWVFFTDADCVLQPKHIETMLQIAAIQNRKIVFGPVLYDESNEKYPFQRIENVNTQAVTEAFLQLGKPMMVNGANMLVHHSKLPEYIAAQRLDYPGGDDVFFAQKLKRDDFSFYYDQATAVYTNAAIDLKSWLYQRIRWVHKSKSYEHPIHWMFSGLFGVLMLFFALMISLLIIQRSWMNSQFIFISIFWLIPFFFHRKWALKWKVSIPFLSHLVLTLIYPFYTLFLVIVTVIPVVYHWKNRTYRSANWSMR